MLHVIAAPDPLIHGVVARSPILMPSSPSVHRTVKIFNVCHQCIDIPFRHRVIQ